MNYYIRDFYKKKISDLEITNLPAILFVLFFLVTNFTNAQSIDDLISTAYTNNIELQILEKQYQAKLEVVAQIPDRPDPELGIGLFPAPVETRVGRQISRVSATQTFPKKGSVAAKKSLANANAQPILEQIKVLKLDIAYQIRMAYLELYELDKSYEIIQKNLLFLKSLETLALAKVETGKGSLADVLFIQLKIKNLKTQLILLKNERQKPLANLNFLLNTKANLNIRTTDRLDFAVLMYQRDSLLANIEANHPMLKIYELRQVIAEQTIKVNTLKNQPTFGVGLDYITVVGRTDAIPNGNGRDILQLKGMVKIPLYKSQYEAKEQEERLKIDALELQKENKSNQILNVITKAYTDYEVAKIQLNLYQEQIKTTQSVISILESKYSSNNENFETLLNVEMTLIDYDLKLLQAIIKSHRAKNTIEQFVTKN